MAQNIESRFYGTFQLLLKDLMTISSIKMTIESEYFHIGGIYSNFERTDHQKTEPNGQLKNFIPNKMKGFSFA
jgi:hypothetical protein